MKVYVQAPTGLSRAMTRVADALVRYLPTGWQVVEREDQADLVVLHVVGYPDTVSAIERVQARGQRYALIQYCLRTTQRPQTADWLPLWQGAASVWSYYDLPALMEADGLGPDDRATVPFYYAPLGVDGEVFTLTGSERRRYTILTSGYVAETEGVREAAEATRRVGGLQYHLGPDLRLGSHVRHVVGIPDATLAGVYRRSQFVAGLRREEGFELPAAEGLLCGVRPVMFDAPHYRAWFDGLAEFIPEGTEAEVTDALEALFRAGARPVTEAERQLAAWRFDWQRIAGGFWLAIAPELLTPTHVRGPRRKRRLLWCGDAVAATGFAKCTHETLDVLRHEWDVHVLGLNYYGDPHDYPYPIWPAVNLFAKARNQFGLDRLPSLIQRIGPDVVVVQNDPWNLPPYMGVCGNVPVVAALAVDGLNCRGNALNGLAGAIFWTQFGLAQARRGGYTGPSAVVPLGVDVVRFQPKDRTEARKRLGLDRAGDGRAMDAFIVGTVGRNQPRKRLDLTLLYFAEWVKAHQVPDAYLYLHVAPTGEQAFDVRQLAHFLGIASRVIQPPVEMVYGIPEEYMAWTYSAFDVQLSTPQGEGWGLCNMEGMACGVPQIVPHWSALGEWCEDAALKVPCSSVAATPNGVNVIGGIADQAATVEALDTLYRDAPVRDELRRRGLALVQRPAYRWPNIGARFAEALREMVDARVLGPAVAEELTAVVA